MGRLVPAGTGLSFYRKLGIRVAGEDTADVDMPDEESEKTLDMDAVN